MRVQLITNPVSGRGGGPAAAERLADELAARDVEVAEYRTRAAGDAERFAGLLRVVDADVVAVVGGDGTVHEVVNGLREKIPIVPCFSGTANILAMELGIPRDAAALARFIVEGERRDFDVGVVNGRKFTLMAGMGLDGRIIERVAERRVGRSITKFSYLMPGFQTWWDYRMPPLTVTLDGKLWQEGPGSLIVTNVPGYAGLFTLDAAADPCDGELNVVFLKPRSRGALLSQFFALACGTLFEREDVAHATARKISVRSEHSCPAQVDGEFFGFAPCDMEVLPSALTVVCA